MLDKGTHTPFNALPVNPTDGPPAELKRGREEIDHDQSAITRAGDRGALLGGVKSHEEAQVEHAEPHEEAGPDQGPAAAQCVGEEGDEDGAGTHLDDAVDSRGEERLGVAGDA